jgi:hypothetical protein
VQAVTWSGSGRLFAAAVTEATTESLAVTVYRFADEPRDITLKPWGLEPGGSYVLEAGPASALGAPPQSIEQTVQFDLTRRDEGVEFTLPGRQVYAVRIRQVAPGSPVAKLQADPAIAPRDIQYNQRRGALDVTVHNIGTVEATDLVVRLYEGRGTDGSVIGTETIPLIEAPLDLVPRTEIVRFDNRPSGRQQLVTVELDPEDALDEITEVNNIATAVVGGRAPDYSPPMLIELDPSVASPGDSVRVGGRHFREGIEALSWESPTTDMEATYVDGQSLILQTAPEADVGVYLVSVRNVDGLQSNLLPLRLTRDTPGPTPSPTGLPRQHVIYLPAGYRAK